ncbi:MAG: DUF6702 family protein, partial [Acidobacteriota bacterium]
MNYVLKTSYFTFLAFAFVSSTLAAHTYHTSLTRIDYNEKEKLAEISIQMFPHDLVPLLEKRAKKNIDLEKTSDIDTIILKYLNENFVLKDKEGGIKKLVWVGKEIQADTIFVYVEIPLENDFEGFTLQNTLFFESFPEQTNLVIARFNQKKADLLYKASDKFKEIKAANLSEEKSSS